MQVSRLDDPAARRDAVGHYNRIGGGEPRRAQWFAVCRLRYVMDTICIAGQLPTLRGSFHHRAPHLRLQRSRPSTWRISVAVSLAPTERCGLVKARDAIQFGRRQRPEGEFAALGEHGVHNLHFDQARQSCTRASTQRKPRRTGASFSTPGGTRTPNLLIRNQNQGVRATLAIRRTPLCPLGFRLSLVRIVCGRFSSSRGPNADQMRPSVPSVADTLTVLSRFRSEVGGTRWLFVRARTHQCCDAPPA